MRRYFPLFWVAFTMLIFIMTGSSLLSGYADKQRPENLKNMIIYTTLPVEQAAVLADRYEKSAGLKVSVVPLAPNALHERLLLERAQPQADVVLASRDCLDALNANGLLAAYASEQTDIVSERFKEEDGFWTGVWYDPIVFAANKDFIEAQPFVPVRWSDLTAPSKLRIGITDFLAADAAANLLYTLVATTGENKTLDFLQQLHPRVVQYAKFLATPVRMAGLGEVDIAIAVQSESIRYMKDGFPIRIIYPEDGTAYFLTGAAIVRQSSNEADARQFIDWLLQDDAQAVLQQNGFYFIPTNHAITAYKTIAVKKIELFDQPPLLDVKEKRRLLDRWVQTVRLGSR